jgi:protein O-mannosyl-transferase
VNTRVGAEASPESRRSWVYVGLIVAAASLAYANSFDGTFQFDDFPAIAENPTLRRLWPLWAPFCPPPGALTVSGRPILNFGRALNFAISGYRAWSYHALNLLMHMGSALTLFGIARRTLARFGAAGAEFSALSIAMIWVVHPLTTESVTYIVQRAESQMALFYLLTLYCFIRSTDSKRAGEFGIWRVLAVGCCWLGMATKEVMVSAPVAVLLYDRIFVAGSWRGAWRAARGLYFSMAASWIMLAWLVASTGWDRGGTSGFHVGVSWVGYWLTQGEAMVRYIGLALWPYPLAFDYGPSSAPPSVAYLLTGLVLCAFAATVVGCFRGRPWAFLAGVWFLVLAPTSVMPGVLQFAAEHRVYLPLAAIVTAVVMGLRAAAHRWVVNARLRTMGLAALLIIAVACLGTATAMRNRVYSDELALWMDTVARRPLSALAQANAGKALLERGRIAEGLAHSRMAVSLDPMKPAARYNLGLAFENEMHWTDALEEFEAAANLNPKLFYAEFRAGRLLDRLGRPGEAEQYLRYAIANAPDFAEAHGSLGVALAMEDRAAAATGEFERSLALEPNQPEVEFDLGVSLGKLGRVEEAISHYSSAVRLDPKYAEARLNLGVSLAQEGKFADALPALEGAAQLKPDSPEAHENLATVLDQLGRAESAVIEYRSALRLRPDYPDAHYNYGNALIHMHDLAGARTEFSEALRLRPDFGAAREMLDRLSSFKAAP